MASEAEWEYAATSAGTNLSEFPWGDVLPTCAYAVINDGGPGCGTGRTMPGCSKPAGNTSHGLCDMVGNLRELVHDIPHSNYDNAPADGSAWIDGAETEDFATKCLLRGGSWGMMSTNPFHELRSHTNMLQMDRLVDVGFRCTRDVR